MQKVNSADEMAKIVGVRKSLLFARPQHRKGSKYIIAKRIERVWHVGIVDCENGERKMFSMGKLYEDELNEALDKTEESHFEKTKHNPSLDFKFVMGTPDNNFCYIVFNETTAKELEPLINYQKKSHAYLENTSLVIVSPKSQAYYESMIKKLKSQNVFCKFISVGKSTFKKPQGVLHKPTVKEFILNTRTDFIDLTCLGSDESSYYYCSNYKNGVLKVPVSHPKSHTLALAPESYWREMDIFWLSDKKEKLDYQKIASYLMNKSAEVGKYNPNSFRSSGFYRNQEGDLYCRSGFGFYGKSDDRFNYFFGRDVYVPNIENADYDKTLRQVKLMMSICESFCWDRPHYARILVGWMLLAPFCGALDYRPHLWVTGVRGTGKTWIFEQFVTTFLGSYCCGFTLDSTAAGVIRTLAGQALPVVHDEFEIEESKRMHTEKQSVLYFLRGCSTSKGQAMNQTKSNASAGVEAFQATSMALLGSIKTSLENPADQARFLLINLNANKRKVQEFNDAKERLKLANPFSWCRSHVDYFFKHSQAVFNDISQLEAQLQAAYPSVCFHSLRCVAAVQASLRLYGFDFNGAEIEEMVKSFSVDVREEDEILVQHLFFYNFWLDGHTTNIRSLILNSMKRWGQRDNPSYNELRDCGIKIVLNEKGKDIDLKIKLANVMLQHRIFASQKVRNWRQLLLMHPHVKKITRQTVVFVDYYRYLRGKEEDRV